MIRLKTPTQIEAIRESATILSQVLHTVCQEVVPGVTTAHLDEVAAKTVKHLGGRPSFLGYHGYPSVLCTSVNAVIIHGIPNRDRLKSGQIVGIDCGIDLNGYYSDAAITVPVGEISPALKRLLQVTRTSLQLAIEQAVNRRRVSDISRAVEGYVTKESMGIVHDYCGHGVGFAIHEAPEIPNYIGRGPYPRLQPGMVLAIEPMVCLGTGDVRVLDDGWTVMTQDGKAAAHFEHTIAIYEDHTEILTEW